MTDSLLLTKDTVADEKVAPLSDHLRICPIKILKLIKATFKLKDYLKGCYNW